jgi:hypothetical protein
MPYDDPEPDDPHLLVGVSLPGDEATTREMAAAFADEFAQMGFDRDRLLRLFANPFYAGAHAARQILGDIEIMRIVVESVRAYGGRTYAVLDAATDDDEPDMPEALRGKRALRVL